MQKSFFEFDKYNLDDDAIEDEIENSEANSNFSSMQSDHGDSDAVIDEIEKYNFLYVFIFRVV